MPSLDEIVRIAASHGQTILLYRCRKCRAERRNQALTDGDVPDVWAMVIGVASRQ